MLKTAVLTGILVLAAATARAELPPPILAEAQENAALCREVGGVPRFQGTDVPGVERTAEVWQPYVTEAELNSDGQTDYVVDLAGLDCENAWSFFCGSAGCPVAVWLSGPKGVEAAWSGHAQAWRLDGQAVVVSLHGQMCSPPRAGFDGCDEVLRFDGAAPAAEAEATAALASSPRPPRRPAEQGAAPAAAPAPSDAPSLPTGPDTAVAEWDFGATADGKGWFGGVRDAERGTRLDWLCGKGRRSVLALSPYQGEGVLVISTDGRPKEVAMTVEGGMAWAPISFADPLFLHIASGAEVVMTDPGGAELGRFPMQGAPLAIGQAEGRCQSPG